MEKHRKPNNENIQFLVNRPPGAGIAKKRGVDRGIPKVLALIMI